MAVSTYLVHVHLYCFHQIRSHPYILDSQWDKQIISSIYMYMYKHAESQTHSRDKCIVYIDLISLFSIINFLSAYRTFYPRHQCPPPPPPPPRRALVPTEGRTFLPRLNVPCGHKCHLGIIVFGTMVLRNECPRGSGSFGA